MSLSQSFNLGKHWGTNLLHADRVLLWRAAGLFGRPPFVEGPPPAEWRSIPAAHRTILEQTARKIFFLGRCLSSLDQARAKA